MADEGIAQKDVYFVAVKIFLTRQGKLFIFKDKFGDWDLPGGRIKKHEFETPIEDVIKRKMGEEVGEGLTYTLDSRPLLTMRHERMEAVEGGLKVRIFAVGYEAEVKEGEPMMSDQHTEMLWVDPKDFDAKQYFKGGWLKGVEEYIEIKKK